MGGVGVGGNKEGMKHGEKVRREGVGEKFGGIEEKEG